MIKFKLTVSDIFAKRLCDTYSEEMITNKVI